MNKWYIENGEQGDIVLSTRIRLARNIDEHPFPNKLSQSGKTEVCEKVRDILLSQRHWDFSYTLINSLSKAQVVSLAERHLISPDFATQKDGALILTEDEAISIMLCEEDHIRLQVMMSGLALQEAYSVADKVDNLLANELSYAFDERLGYLTQCPTNLGTAMRASVMLHLPALTKCGQMGKLANTVSKLGLVIRGAHGEGSSPKGEIYQLSNQITLGISEKEALDNLQSITLQLVAQEREAAKKLLKSPTQIDALWRAKGVLQYARQLSCDEFMELSSLIRLGARNNIFDFDIKKLNELTYSVQPATINAGENKDLTTSQRDIIRADRVRKIFE